VQSPFLILSPSRCGSTTLMHLLNCHPDVRCLLEPFNPDRWGDTYARGVHDLASLDAIVTGIWDTHNGIKHVWGYSGWPFGQDMAFNLRLTAQQGTQVILLTRRNELQRLLSHEIATQTNFWQPENIVRVGSSATTRQLAPLDPASLHLGICRAREATELIRSALAANGTPFTELSYEDVFAPGADLARGLERVDEVLAFLGAGALPAGTTLARARHLLDPAIHKMNGELSYHRVPNIEEVEATCGTDETGHVFT
jgi:hypothetical protein